MGFQALEDEILGFQREFLENSRENVQLSLNFSRFSFEFLEKPQLSCAYGLFQREFQREYSAESPFHQIFQRFPAQLLEKLANFPGNREFQRVRRVFLDFFPKQKPGKRDFAAFPAHFLENARDFPRKPQNSRQKLGFSSFVGFLPKKYQGFAVKFDVFRSFQQSVAEVLDFIAFAPVKFQEIRLDFRGGSGNRGIFCVFR